MNERAEWTFFGSRTVNLKGGAKYVTIPSKVVEQLGLQDRDQVLFFLNRKLNKMVIGKSKDFQDVTGGIIEFRAPMTEKQLLKLINQAMERRMRRQPNTETRSAKE